MRTKTHPSRQTRRTRAMGPGSLHKPVEVNHKPPPTQDRALYRCECGHKFTADVSTSVDCPYCGESQAW